MRPGEKLYEEKLMAEEGLKKTRNELIHIGCPIPFEVETFLKELQTLMDMAYTNAEDIREKVAEVVTTYHPAGEHGSEKKGEVYERLLGEEMVDSQEVVETFSQYDVFLFPTKGENYGHVIFEALAGGCMTSII